MKYFIFLMPKLWSKEKWRKLSILNLSNPEGPAYDFHEETKIFAQEQKQRERDTGHC